MAETVQISVPDALVNALAPDRSELSRKTLEALVAQSYRVGALTHLEVGDILGLDRWQVDAFLKRSQAQRASEADEFASDLARLRKIEKK